MAFDVSLLGEVPHRAFSVVEDLEYGLQLGRAGVRVVYLEEAHVWGEMPAGEEASRSQRRRWEGGRMALARSQGPALLAEAIRKRSALQMDLALDLVIPPLTTVGLVGVLGLGAGLWIVGRDAGHLAVTTWGLAAGFLCIYLARGWQLSGTGARGLLDLACAPAYAAWKLTLPWRGKSGAKGEWIRTPRKSEVRS
jgi:hypothetical protein